MDKPQPVEPEPRYIYIMHKVLAFQHKRVVGFPVPPNSQYFGGTALNRNYIGPGDLVFCFIQFVDNKIGVNLVYCIPVIIGYGVPAFFSLTFFYVRMERLRIIKVYIPVKTTGL